MTHAQYGSQVAICRRAACKRAEAWDRWPARCRPPRACAELGKQRSSCASGSSSSSPGEPRRCTVRRSGCGSSACVQRSSSASRSCRAAPHAMGSGLGLRGVRVRAAVLTRRAGACKASARWRPACAAPALARRLAPRAHETKVRDKRPWTCTWAHGTPARRPQPALAARVGGALGRAGATHNMNWGSMLLAPRRRAPATRPPSGSARPARPPRCRASRRPPRPRAPRRTCAHRAAVSRPPSTLRLLGFHKRHSGAGRRAAPPPPLERRAGHAARGRDPVGRAHRSRPPTQAKPSWDSARGAPGREHEQQAAAGQQRHALVGQQEVLLVRLARRGRAAAPRPPRQAAQRAGRGGRGAPHQRLAHRLHARLRTRRSGGCLMALGARAEGRERERPCC